MSKVLKITAGSIFVASTALAVASYNVQKDQVVDRVADRSGFTFDEVDEFKRVASRKLITEPAQHTIVESAHNLALMRIDNMYAVCSDSDEIEASQYLELAEIIDPITERAPAVGNEIEMILSQGSGITDCQFRIIEAIAQQTSAS